MKQLTAEQQNDLYNFSYVVLFVKPFISKKEFTKTMLHFAKSKKMPIKAVKEYLKEGE